jgi:hypothetical protein
MHRLRELRDWRWHRGTQDWRRQLPKHRLAARGVQDRRAGRRDMLLGDAHGEACIGLVGLAQHLDLERRPELLQRADAGVAHRHVEPHVVHARAARQCLEGEAHAAAVRLHQPAGAQLGAAVVARHDRGDVTEPAVQQHREHGTAGGAMRLAVVAHADAIGAAGWPDDIGPAVVRRVRELGVHRADERSSVVAAGTIVQMKRLRSIVCSARCCATGTS